MFPRVGNKILCFSFPFSGAEARDIGFRLFVHKIDKKDGDFLYDFGSAPPEGEKAGGGAGEEKRRAVGGAGPYKEYEGRSVVFTGAIHESPVYAGLRGRFVKRPYGHTATLAFPAGAIGGKENLSALYFTTKKGKEKARNRLLFYVYAHPSFAASDEGATR